MWWSGDRSFEESVPALPWRPDDRLTEGVLRFRAVTFDHLVYPSVRRVAPIGGLELNADLDRV